MSASSCFETFKKFDLRGRAKKGVGNYGAKRGRLAMPSPTVASDGGRNFK
jgi:hypothetical protein